MRGGPVVPPFNPTPEKGAVTLFPLPRQWGIPAAGGAHPPHSFLLTPLPPPPNPGPHRTAVFGGGTPRPQPRAAAEEEEEEEEEGGSAARSPAAHTAPPPCRERGGGGQGRGTTALLPHPGIWGCEGGGLREGGKERGRRHSRERCSAPRSGGGAQSPPGLRGEGRGQMERGSAVWGWGWGGEGGGRSHLGSAGTQRSLGSGFQWGWGWESPSASIPRLHGA